MLYNRLLTLPTVFLLTVIHCAGPTGENTIADSGESGSTSSAPVKIPDFSLTTIPDKLIITPKTLLGNVVLIDFWATWCGPCKKGIPMLNKINGDYKNKKVIILGLSVDEDDVGYSAHEKVLDYTAKIDVDYKIAIADRNLQVQFRNMVTKWRRELGACNENASSCIPEMPVLFIVDREGYMVSGLVPIAKDPYAPYKKARSKIEALLAN